MQVVSSGRDVGEPQKFLKNSFVDHIETCFTVARVRGDSINP